MGRTKANGLLLIAGAIWGMGFVAQSTAMRDIGPFLFVGLRFALAVIVVAPFALAEGRKATVPVGRTGILGFVACGAALFGAIATQQVGLITTTVTNSGFLTGLYVIFTPVLALVLQRKAPHPVIWPAALSALAGIYLLSGGALVSLKPGDLLTIASAMCCAVQMVLIARFAAETGRPIALAITQFAVCAVLGLAATALLGEPVSLPGLAGAVPEIIYAGAFSGGIAFTLQVIGQRHTTAAQAAIFMSSEALFAALFGAVILGERIGATGYLGGLFIFAAMIAVEVVPALDTRGRNALPLTGEGATQAATTVE